MDVPQISEWAYRSSGICRYANTREEAWNLLKDDTDIDGSGGWVYSYVRDFINSNWDE